MSLCEFDSSFINICFSISVCLFQEILSSFAYFKNHPKWEER